MTSVGAIFALIATQILWTRQLLPTGADCASKRRMSYFNGETMMQLFKSKRDSQGRSERSSRAAKAAKAVKAAKAAKVTKAVRIVCGDATVFSGALNTIPVKDDVLIAKSIEFFNDPAPCYIHRSAVQVRLYGEFEQWLDSTGGAGGAGGAGGTGGDADAVGEYCVDMADLPELYKAWFILC